MNKLFFFIRKKLVVVCSLFSSWDRTKQKKIKSKERASGDLICELRRSMQQEVLFVANRETWFTPIPLTLPTDSFNPQWWRLLRRLRRLHLVGTRRKRARRGEQRRFRCQATHTSVCNGASFFVFVSFFSHFFISFHFPFPLPTRLHWPLVEPQLAFASRRASLPWPFQASVEPFCSDTFPSSTTSTSFLLPSFFFLLYFPFRFSFFIFHFWDETTTSLPREGERVVEIGQGVDLLIQVWVLTEPSFLGGVFVLFAFFETEFDGGSNHVSRRSNAAQLFSSARREKENECEKREEKWKQNIEKRPKKTNSNRDKRNVS